ncbi:M48 family metallopeptidase [Paraflavitalea pollutisoli]|uniref:M48 family metallopeptidase n=1 Tax=Paraflavitalea pollutisoli TaxID=3034143 RepID=UPI0023EBD363|nr:M48 family metallopeptidase [Paraflavitalea sp. H1-2-19X]
MMKPFNPAARHWHARYHQLLLLACLLLAATTGWAQNTVFAPLPSDDGILSQLYTRFEEQHKQQVTSLPKENREDYKKIYQARWDHIKAKFDDKEIYTDKAAQQYLDAISNELIRTNPVLAQKTFRCFFSRSAVPNASYIGHGIILFNMGLFHRLDNESQAAFVIAHEIAHFIMNHSENAINKYVAFVNSKEIQAELRDIKGSQYGKRDRFDKLVKDMTFSHRRHSRDHETEADSVAVALLSNTRFDPRGALSTLALLDTIDAEPLDMAEALKAQFHTPAYPFQKKWIAKEEGLLGGHANLVADTVLADSLKTHPDCQLRIRQLMPAIERQAQSGKQLNAIDVARFEQFRQHFRYETIAYTFSNKNYTRSLYLTLALLQQHPGDQYLVTHTGNLFNSMYTAQKTHTLGKYVDLPTPGYSASYNLLLQFVQNLHREQYAAIGYHFLSRHQEKLGTYEPFKAVYNNSAQIVKE